MHTGAMSDEPTTPAEHHDEGHDEGIVQPVGSPEHPTDEQVEVYDLDGDGKISLIENERARLGIIDARLEQIAEEGGVKGFVADAAHHVVDRLDNDDNDDNGDGHADDEPHDRD
jgi:hypothetical protein